MRDKSLNQVSDTGSGLVCSRKNKKAIVDIQDTDGRRPACVRAIVPGTIKFDNFSLWELL